MLLPLWRTAYAAAPMATINQYLAVLFLYPTSVVALVDSIIEAKDWLVYSTYIFHHILYQHLTSPAGGSILE